MSHFEIYPVAVGQGQIALSPLPGRYGDIQSDLAKVAGWGASLVLTMVTQAELDNHGSGQLEDLLHNAGMRWQHLPVEDYQTPTVQMDIAIKRAISESEQVLNNRGRVLIHCFGGCGRSGMMALRIMIAVGEMPNDALLRLRHARPCAVETADQLLWAQST